MNRLQWIVAALAVLMVLLAFSGAFCIAGQEFVSAQEAALLVEKAGSAFVSVAAALAIMLAWLAGKLEKPVRLLGLSIGVTAGISALAMAVCVKDTAAMARFVLILAMLLAILWLVGSMIRRHLTERK